MRSHVLCYSLYLTLSRKEEGGNGKSFWVDQLGNIMLIEAQEYKREVKRKAYLVTVHKLLMLVAAVSLMVLPFTFKINDPPNTCFKFHMLNLFSSFCHIQRA